MTNSLRTGKYIYNGSEKMYNNENKMKLEEILKQYDESIRNVYTGITKLEGNAILKKYEKRAKIKQLIIQEVNKNVD